MFDYCPVRNIDTNHQSCDFDPCRVVLDGLLAPIIFRVDRTANGAAEMCANVTPVLIRQIF